MAIQPLETLQTRGSQGQGQGAPRTARCIKTLSSRVARALVVVREHPAPLGALRLAGSSPAGGTHHTSGTTPHLCVTSSLPHGWAAVTGSKGLEQAGT